MNTKQIKVNDNFNKIRENNNRNGKGKDITTSQFTRNKMVAEPKLIKRHNSYFYRGITYENGIINGNGITNGEGFFNNEKKGGKMNKNSLINGNGMRNNNSKFRASGACGGMVNGNGITNGNGVGIFNSEFRASGAGGGITNGNGIKYPPIKYRTKHKKIPILMTITIISILLLAPIFILRGNERDRISIDGNFQDWKNEIIYEDSIKEKTINSNINLKKYSISSDSTKLYFYISTCGPILGSTNNEGDIIQIFIDSDLNCKTGYSLKNQGCDFMIEIYGKNNIIFSSMYYQFDNERISNDWNGWETMFEVNAICMNNELETELWFDDIGIIKGEDVNVIFHSLDLYGNEDFSDKIISTGNGALNVVQKSVSSNIINKGISSNFIELKMLAYGYDIEINSILLEGFSTANEKDIDSISIIDENGKELSRSNFKNNFAKLNFNPSISLETNEFKTVFVVVDILKTATDGHVLGLKVSSVNADTNAITINGEIKVTYIESITEKITIDGAFEDWKNPFSDEKREVLNPNIDITKYNTKTDSDYSSFYMKVDGEILAGVDVPTNKARSITELNRPTPGKENNVYMSSGNREDFPLPIITGGDTIFIFIETHDNFLIKYNLMDNLYVDKMIEIKGQNGIIISSNLYEYSGNNSQEWKWKQIDQIDVLNNRKEIELSAKILPKRTIFHIVDWSNTQDFAYNPLNENIIAENTRGEGDVIFTEIMYDPSGSDDPHEWVEIYNSLGEEISISGWRFKEGGTQHTISAYSGDLTLDSHEYAVIVDDGATFLNDYPSYSGTIIDSSFSLSNSGETLELLDDYNGNVVDTVSYSDDADEGYSLEKDLDSGSWGQSPSSKGTPGTENEIPEYPSIFIPILALITLFIYFNKKNNKIKCFSRINKQR